MDEHTSEISGLRSIVVGSGANSDLAIVLLHGYSMGPESLAPFAHSMGCKATFYFPQGPIGLQVGARAWWPIDEERRARSLAVGPRDLCAEDPQGRAPLRAQLCNYLDELRMRRGALRTILGGFSQGAMLACDTLLHEQPDLTGLALLSGSRISIADWSHRAGAARALPVFISHGRTDPDLAFAAGEELRDFLIGAGAAVNWLPFDGGHEIPFKVWRELRKFIATVAPTDAPASDL